MTKTVLALSVAIATLTMFSAPVFAQSKSIADANKHHAEQRRASEQKRQQDNRTVQQANTNNNNRRR